MSDGIVPHSNQLQQQGTVDWGQLAGNLIHFTIDALSRYSAANIDIYTLQIGRLICSQFELSIDGRRKVSEALSKLKYLGSFGNAIWFGFGIRHVVRTLQMTEQGFMCLALCASLLECYHENIASEILNELTKTLKAPPELTPSINQWKALLHACNGTFATTSLGERVSYFTQLRYHGLGMNGRTQTRVDDYASPKSIAEVLQGIGAITRGQMKSMTVVGSNDACIIAAFSEWLFGLRISINNGADSRELFTNCPGQSVQLLIILGLNATTTEQQTETSALQLYGKTYHLMGFSPLLQLRSEFGASFNRGRVPWNTLLTTVFGGDFECVYKDETLTLAKAIGAAARLFRAIVSAEPGVPMPIIRAWETYTSSSSGRGYIASIIEWLPELAPLRRRMESACQISFEEAKVQYENQIAKLRSLCSCFVCAPDDRLQSGVRQEDVVQADMQGESTAKEETQEHGTARGETHERFCQVVIVETIIALGLELSKIVLEQDLLPKRLGLERFYRIYEDTRRLHKINLYHFESLDPDIESMMNNKNRDSLLDHLGPFALICLTRISSGATSLKTCLEFFSGASVDKNYFESHASAISNNGICIWLDILQDLSDEPEVSEKIHIAPGCIEHLGKPFDLVIDGKRDIYTKPRIVLGSVSAIKTANLNVTETSFGLEVYYVVEGETTNGVQPLRIPPFSPTTTIARARGWVHCRKPFSGPCPPVHFHSDIPKFDADDSLQPITIFDKEIRVLKANKISRCAVLAISETHENPCVLKDQRHCLNCYLRAAISDKIDISYWVTSWTRRDRTSTSSSPLCIVCESGDM